MSEPSNAAREAESPMSVNEIRPAQAVIERFEKLTIVGWAFTSAAAPARLELFCDDRPVATELSRVSRQDVCEVFRLPPEELFGYEITLLPTIWESLPLGSSQALVLRLHADGMPLEPALRLDRGHLDQWISGIAQLGSPIALEAELVRAVPHVAWAGGTTVLSPAAATWLTTEAAARGWSSALGDPNLAMEIGKAAQVRGLVEVFKDLLVRGWAMDVARGTEVFEVRCNGTVVDVEVIRTEREDVRSAFDAQRVHLGFEFTVPATVWALAHPDEANFLEIFVNGTALSEGRLVFDRPSLESCISRLRVDEASDEAIGNLEAGRVQRQFRALLLLEHLIAAGGVALLGLSNAVYMTRLAARFGLSHSLQATVSEDGIAKPLPDSAWSLIWRLQRRFNQLVDADGANAAEALEDTLRPSGLQGDDKVRFLTTLVPFFCHTGRFEQLARWLDLRTMLSLPEGTDNWQRSLILPFFAHAGEVEAAAERLGRMSAADPGWLNTECVLETCRAAISAVLKGQATIASLESLVRALLVLLDGFKGDPWARLRDVNLIRSLVHIKANDWLLQDDLRHQVAMASLRHYGLSPAFWEQFALHDPLLGASDTLEMQRANQCFEWILGRLTSTRPLDVADLPKLCDALDGFRRWGNLDADAMERELFQTLAPAIFAAASHTKEPSDLLANALARLERIDFVEPVRLACFPGAHLQPQVVAAIPALEARIRSISGVDLVPHADLQKVVIARLHELALARQARRSDEMARLYRSIVPLLLPLKRHAAGYSGWEFHAEACLLAHPGDSAVWADLHDNVQGADKAIGVEGAEPAGIRCAIDLLKAFELRANETALRSPLSMAMSKERPDAGLLVVVCSPRAELLAHQARLHQSWGARLRALGIPLIFCVGCDDAGVPAPGRLEANVLTVPVSDRQHDRPRKTLALVEWVFGSTDFTRLFKIDGACRVDVDRLFGAQSYRAHHYHGRVVERREGETGRRIAGELIDKSPEPSRYADGRAGYTLTRHAMSVLLSQAGTVAGKHLVANSAYEDKLVGDLLNMGRIDVSGAGHIALIRARCGDEPSAVPVSPNAFTIGLHSPTLVQNLADSASSRPPGQQPTALGPERIWPTLDRPSMGDRPDHNQLELRSTLDRISALRESPLLVIAVVRNESLLLPHFLTHYRAMGVRHFVMVDNCSNDGSREYLSAQTDVVLYCADGEYRHSHYGVAWQQAILAAHASGKWALLADADEFLVFRDCERISLPDYANSLAKAGHDAASIRMVDMYPQGPLSTGNLDNGPPFEIAGFFDRQPLIRWKLGSGYYSNGETWLSAMRHRLIPDSAPNLYTSQKVALLRYQPWIRFSEGLHYVSDVHPCPDDLYFAHFKYHAAFAAKVDEEIRRQQHYNEAEEYKKYAELAMKPAVPLYDEQVSARYSGSQSFKGAERDQ